jgi:hypothetical protein
LAAATVRRQEVDPTVLISLTQSWRFSQSVYGRRAETLRRLGTGELCANDIVSASFASSATSSFNLDFAKRISGMVNVNDTTIRSAASLMGTPMPIESGSFSALLNA